MRLTDKQKAEVVTDYAAGKSKSEIARKYGLSEGAIRKVLRNYKSTKSTGKVRESTETERTQAEIRQDIIRKATNALYGKDYDKLSPDTLLKIIERLTYVNSITPKEAFTAKEELRAIVEQIKVVADGSDE